MTRSTRVSLFDEIFSIDEIDEAENDTNHLTKRITDLDTYAYRGLPLKPPS